MPMKTPDEAMNYATSCVGLSCNLSDAKSRSVVEATIRFLEIVGWQCVPREATEEMTTAARITDLWDVSVPEHATDAEHVQATLSELAIAWEAMLAAAPRLPGVER